MQDILDSKSPPMFDSSESSSGSEDSEEEMDLPSRDNGNHAKAEDEFRAFEEFKRNKYRPSFERSKSTILRGTDVNVVYEILVGPVAERGKDLPSRKNLADYIDKKGRMEVLKFFIDHKKMFPTMFILAQCEAAGKVVEVGCERFFGLAGYVSSPRRTRLGVRTYERLAMLASIVQSVFIDNEWVAKEYLRRCKNGSWKKGRTDDAVKCWNL